MSGRPRATFGATIEVPLAPEDAFVLFTARGEQAWVEGWDPEFPAPSPDDTVPGTVFRTDVGGHDTTWLVTDSAPPHRISYARLAVPDTAARVTVELRATSTGSLVRVDYDCTALRPEADEAVRRLAREGEKEVASWEGLIGRYLTRTGAGLSSG